MGHRMIAIEALNIATGFAARAWGTMPEGGSAQRSSIEPTEWVVHIPIPGWHNRDPSSAIVIVDEVTRRARFFPVM